FNSGGAELTVRDSAILDNQAVGGRGNTGSGPVAFVGAATGGAIDNSIDLFLFGDPDHVPPTLSVVNCVISGNEVAGGDNNSGSGVRVFAGAGLGGGIANYLGALADVSGSLLAGNRAVGGVGGLGAGGGIFNAIGEVPPAGGTIVLPIIVT